jgi:hypothetical protein
MDDITFFATTNARNTFTPFGIRENDRFSHTYIIGKTGVGKTTLLKTKIRQDIEKGRGFAVFDPHGDLAESVIEMIPEIRKQDLIYFNIPDPSIALRYNPLKRVSKEKRPLVASGLLEAFKKLFGTDAWGVGMEHILRNCLLTLLDQKQTDLSDILRLLNDKSFRYQCIKNVDNESVREFWMEEYAKYPPYTRQAAIRPIQNKVGAFLSNPITKRILVENKSDVSFRLAMDCSKIVVINLSKGRIGDDASNLLGGLFLTAMGLSAFSRQDQPEGDRQPFFIYCDEFQNFTTLFLVNALSELRKYRIGLILANQYMMQLETKIRDAVLGNAGTLIVFRVGVADATYLAREFDGKFTTGDIIQLPNFNVYLRLMIDGVSSKGFSAEINIR